MSQTTFKKLLKNWLRTAHPGDVICVVLAFALVAACAIVVGLYKLGAFGLPLI